MNEPLEMFMLYMASRVCLIPKPVYLSEILHRMDHKIYTQVHPYLSARGYMNLVVHLPNGRQVTLC